MNDTSPEILARFHYMIMKKSPEERLLMGCSMFDTAKQIVTHSLIEQHPQLDFEQMKGEIFLRFYGMDFSQDDKKRILKALSIPDNTSSGRSK